MLKFKNQNDFNQFEFEDKENKEDSLILHSKINYKEIGVQTDENFGDIENYKIDYIKFLKFVQKTENDDSFKRAFQLFEYFRQKCKKID